VDSDRIFCRGWHRDADGKRNAVRAVLPAAEHPSPASLDCLTREYDLKDELEGAWALLPLEPASEHGRTMLLLKDPGGEPLERLLGAPELVLVSGCSGIGKSAVVNELH
jgi:putative ribosome biogenesis GTPase RsgA